MNQKAKSIFILLLCTFFLNANHFYNFIEITKEFTNNDTFIAETPKNSVTILTPFIIDDTGGGDYTWAEAVLQPWGSGGGTSNNPYIIENIYIDAGGSGNGLLIRNSNVHFIVKNSTFINSDGGSFPNYNAGLKLENVNNGIVLNNTARSNVNVGIMLYGTSSSNNKIIDNRALDNSGFNTGYGIYIYDADYTEITNNTAINNERSGIYCNNGYQTVISGNFISESRMATAISLGGVSDNSIITNNTLENNWGGIYLWGGESVTFSKNRVHNNTNSGLQIDFCSNTQIRNNIFNSDDINDFGGLDHNYSGNILNSCGFSFSTDIAETSSHIVDTTNIVNGKIVYYYVNEINLKPENFTNAGQIILVNCQNSLISNMEFSKTSGGITLHHSTNNTIFNVNSSFNTGSGIAFSYSDNNKVIKCVTNNNKNHGIYLYRECNGNLLTKNTVIDNVDDGIQVFRYSNFNNITNNYLRMVDAPVYSQNRGIFLSDQCDNNIISNNSLINHYYGVDLYDDSSYNTVYKNKFIENTYHARNAGVANKWDNGYIGNYWNNYVGTDSDDDGIGDLPYNFGSGIDNYPIWNDGFDGGYINIDDLATGVGAHNWTWAKSKYWCSGQGTFNNPYIIEDLSIDLLGGSIGILIENSGAYFMIRNCTIINVAQNHPYGSIKLMNTDNGAIINNTVTGSYYGIYLQTSCNNNTIIKNNVIGNSDTGIHIRIDSHNNKIIDNTIRNNGWGGIYFYDNCDDNIISENYLENNDGRDIYFSTDIDQNNITMNKVLDSGNGVRVVHSDCNVNIFYLNNF